LFSQPIIVRVEAGGLVADADDLASVTMERERAAAISVGT
jgi:hypothetical protein